MVFEQIKQSVKMLDRIKSIFGISSPFKNLGDEEFRKAVKSAAKPVIIDVRSKSEFSKGKIHNAMNIDIFSPNFNDRVKNMDPNKQYFLYCQSGMRSKRACRRMLKFGFEEVTNLKGGISNYEGRIV